MYSRKVEYLYTLIYQTLDHLARKASRPQRNSSVQADGGDADAFFHDDEGGFLPLDDVIAEATNIDMVEPMATGDAETDADALLALGRKNSTPTSHIKSARALATATPLSIMASFQAHAGGGGVAATANDDSFRLNTLSVHPSGALMMDDNRRALLDLSLDPILANGSPRTPKLTFGAASPGETGHGVVGSLAGALAGAADAHGDDDDDEDVGDLGGGFDVAGTPPPETAAHQRGPSRGVRFAEDTTPADPWEMLNPHDPSGPVERPFRRGKTYQMPADPLAVSRGDVPGPAAKRVASTRRSTLGVFSSSRLGPMAATPFFEEFKPLFRAERKRRAAERRKAMKTNLVRGTGAAAMNAQVDDSDSDGEADGPGIFTDHHGDDDFGAPDVDVGGFDEALAAARTGADGGAGADDGMPQLHLSLASYGSYASTSKTYEDLCREHIERFMRGANKFAQESRLSNRVAEWQDRLEPLLEEQEHREKFDIHQYGSRIIDRIVAEIDELNLDDYDGDDDDATKREVDFNDVTSGFEAPDVARVFLSTLQLANQGNVEIVRPSTEADEEAAAQGFRLRLLSAAAPPSLRSYLAPSKAVEEGAIDVDAEVSEIEAMLADADISATIGKQYRSDANLSMTATNTSTRVSGGGGAGAGSGSSTSTVDEADGSAVAAAAAPSAGSTAASAPSSPDENAASQEQVSSQGHRAAKKARGKSSAADVPEAKKAKPSASPLATRGTRASSRRRALRSKQ